MSDLDWEWIAHDEHASHDMRIANNPLTPNLPSRFSRRGHSDSAATVKRHLCRSTKNHKHVSARSLGSDSREDRGTQTEGKEEQKWIKDATFSHSPESYDSPIQPAVTITRPTSSQGSAASLVTNPWEDEDEPRLPEKEKEKVREGGEDAGLGAFWKLHEGELIKTPLLLPQKPETVVPESLGAQELEQLDPTETVRSDEDRGVDGPDRRQQKS